jgi:hypothetical protein
MQIKKEREKKKEKKKKTIDVKSTGITIHAPLKKVARNR